jgi:hypothetical protein
LYLGPSLRPDLYTALLHCTSSLHFFTALLQDNEPRFVEASGKVLRGDTLVKVNDVPLDGFSTGASFDEVS